MATVNFADGEVVLRLSVEEAVSVVGSLGCAYNEGESNNLSDRIHDQIVEVTKPYASVFLSPIEK